MLTYSTQQRNVVYMADRMMRRVPSSVFRLTYSSLEEPVVVTALGRVIGWWTPLSRGAQDEVPARPEASAGTTGASPSPSVESAPRSAASAGSIPEGREPDGSVAGTFNRVPFSPAPKARAR